MIPLLLAAALAAPGTEIALVLDNSCSMIQDQAGLQGEKVPANDPERAAVLGTLIVEGLARGSADRVSVIAFGDTATSTPRVVHTDAEIRGIPPVNGTFFREPLKEARRTLVGSDRDGRLLVFFTDGMPNDVATTDEAAALVGLAEDDRLQSLVLGLYSSEFTRLAGEPFLRAIVRDPRDLTLMTEASEVVGAFTHGYARALGSRPVTGELSAGATLDVDVPRYVAEVMAVLASARPGPAFTATLTSPTGPVTAQAQGDNGCPPDLARRMPGRVCDPPRRHYQVFRAPNDRTRASRWTLALPQAPDAAQYGLILRYDLVASLTVPPSVRIGDTVPIEALLLSQGQVFDDEVFFAADGFAVEGHVGDDVVTLTHVGGGRFTGSWSPTLPTDGQAQLARVSFQNKWLELHAHRPIAVEGFLDLALSPSPSPLALGAWRAERAATRRCATLDLSGSGNADRVAVTCVPEGLPADFTATCGPVAGSEALLGSRTGQPLRWEVCVEAPSCCGDAPSGAAGVRIAGKHPHYAPGAVVVPLTFQVEDTGWLRCWWPWLAAAGAALGAGFVVIGMVRPHPFDAAATVRVAGSEAGLRRTSAQVLRELPGGQKGFYRDARVAMNGNGDFVRGTRGAILVLEAGPAGTTRFRRAAGLERKDRRTNTWAAVPDAELGEGVSAGGVYRVGGLHVKFD